MSRTAPPPEAGSGECGPRAAWRRVRKRTRSRAEIRGRPETVGWPITTKEPPSSGDAMADPGGLAGVRLAPAGPGAAVPWRSGKEASKHPWSGRSPPPHPKPMPEGEGRGEGQSRPGREQIGQYSQWRQQSQWVWGKRGQARNQSRRPMQGNFPGGVLASGICPPIV